MDDAKRASIIYGPDLAAIKGKTTCSAAAPHVPTFQAVPIPAIQISAMTMVMIYGGLELLQGLFFRSGVAHFAHLGGMIGGWLMIRYWRKLPPFSSRRR